MSAIFTEVAVRRAAAVDTEACFRVFLESVVDLSRRIGAPWEPDPAKTWTTLEPIFSAARRSRCRVVGCRGHLR